MISTNSETNREANSAFLKEHFAIRQQIYFNKFITIAAPCQSFKLFRTGSFNPEKLFCRSETLETRFRAQLLRQFGNIPEIHIVADMTLKERQWIYPTRDEYITYLKQAIDFGAIQGC